MQEILENYRIAFETLRHAQRRQLDAALALRLADGEVEVTQTYFNQAELELFDFHAEVCNGSGR